MKTAKSLSELKRLVNKSLRDTLHSDIAPRSKEVLKEHIKTDVYDAYTPGQNSREDSKSIYERRGLMKSGDYIDTLFSGSSHGVTMTMLDITPGNNPWAKHDHTPQGTDLSRIINDGLQGNGHGLVTMEPRPYIENAQRDINELVIDTLQRKYGK